MKFRLIVEQNPKRRFNTEGNIINFQSSYKIKENSYSDIFFAVLIREKGNL